MSAFNQSKATVPAVRLIAVERQPEATPESAKVIAIASVQAPAVRESWGLKGRKPVSLEQMVERGY